MGEFADLTEAVESCTMKSLSLGWYLTVVLALAGCSSGNNGTSASNKATSNGADNGSSSVPGSSFSVGEPAMATGVVDVGSDSGAVTARMTAGLWDDNANFNVFLQYLANQATSYATSLPAFDSATTEAAHAASLQRSSSNAIDIALMLDTTGSMTDELSYLQTEFEGISTNVHQRFANVDIRWSLVVYRDAGDLYVTRSFDFTGDAVAFRTNLAAQSADGGGDEPEAVATAFNETLARSWRGASAAQMLIWVADAPHHDADTASVRDALAQSRARGIRIYPVAASSASQLAEATMRVAAQTTGGRYQFLTDDSGIGNAHSEPKVPCYYVTTLAEGILRSVAMELSGKYVDPAPESIVRVVGKPVGDTCQNSGDAGTSQ